MPSNTVDGRTLDGIRRGIPSATEQETVTIMPVGFPILLTTI